MQMSALSESIEDLEQKINTFQESIDKMNSLEETYHLKETKLLLRQFPLSNLKNFQYLHSLQLVVTTMKEEFSHKVNELDNIVSQLKRDIQWMKENRTDQSPNRTDGKSSVKANDLPGFPTGSSMDQN